MPMETSGNGNLKLFIKELSGLLPVVLPESPQFARYSNTTIPLERLAAAAVLPGNTKQVQTIVRLAANHKVPLHPISTGRNWGYGSAQPASVGTVIVDLSAMNQIHEVNAELAYAVIEPGVTQGQLCRYIAEHNLPLLADINGSGPETSIVGNILERGFGIGAYGDRFASACGLEVVLPNGELLRTGLNRFDGARAGLIYKWGLGPYIDGLFTQSNFGIVTRLVVWLQPTPAHLEVCLAQSDQHDQVFALTDAIRRLHLEDTVKTRINVLSRNRLLTIYRQYPWKESGNKFPMSDELARRIAAPYRVASWNIMFALFGTKKQVAASKSRVRELLGPHCSRMVFASRSRLAWAEKFGVLPGIRDLIPTIRSALAVYSGVPTNVALNSPYWRNRSKAPPLTGGDPDRDNCGLIWYAPIIPLLAADVRRFIELSQPILEKFGLDFAPTFTAVSARAFDCTLPILYDRADPAESSKAEACYRELTIAGKTAGFYPYRLGIQAMQDFYDPADPFCKVVDALKDTLDPVGIIAPGRYGRAQQANS